MMHSDKKTSSAEEELVKNTPLFATCGLKALVIHDNHVLLLSKELFLRETQLKWNDLPGGRVNYGEISPQKALARELMEEIGRKDIIIGKPIHVATVRCTDNYHVMATIFLCKAKTREIQLSSEHVDAEWLDLDGKHLLPKWIEGAIDVIKQN